MCGRGSTGLWGPVLWVKTHSMDDQRATAQDRCRGSATVRGPPEPTGSLCGEPGCLCWVNHRLRPGAPLLQAAQRRNFGVGSPTWLVVSGAHSDPRAVRRWGGALEPISQETRGGIGVTGGMVLGKGGG